MINTDNDSPDDEPEDTGPAEIVDDEEPRNVWMRGLFMLIFAILFGLAEMLLIALAVLQFLWLLFSGEKNRFIADTGETLGSWVRDVTLFQTGQSDDKPFPWRRLN